MEANSAVSQFNVDTSKYDPVTSNSYDVGDANWLADIFTLGYTASEREKINRANELTNVSRQNALEEARLNSARQYELYIDSTKYQRAVEDAKKAGINPYLLFSQNINTSSGSSASSTQAHTAKNAAAKANGSSSVVSSALKLLAILALK